VNNLVEKVDKRLSAKVSPATLTHPCTLGIFAKAPEPGQVKTRLCPPLTPDLAAEFYALCLDETIALARATPFRTVLFCSGDAGYFTTRYADLPCRPQVGTDLGERMEHALRQLLAEGSAAAALIGSDTPDLPPGLIAEAFRSLQQHEVVVAPARDGGYVLVGESRHHPELFRDVPWSTPQVLEATRTLARRHAIPLGEVSPWEDVDDAASLQRLVRRSPESRCAAWARAFCAGG